MLGCRDSRRRYCLRGLIVLLGLLSFARLCPGQARPSVSRASARPNGGWGAAWSPPGDRLAFLSSDDGLPADAWICRPQGGGFQRLTHGGADDLAWSADGRSLTFTTRRRGHAQRWQVSLDSGRETPLALPAGVPPQAVAAPSPSGASVAYTLADGDSRDLYLATGAGQPQRLTTGFTVGSIAWSPKGDQIAFDAQTPLSHGLPQVWISDLITKKTAHLGTAGSFGPMWSAKASRLAYTVMYSPPANRIALVAAGGKNGRLIANLLYHGDGVAWSPTADVLAVAVRADKGRQVWLVRADGRITAKLSKRGLEFSSPAWSPDGNRLAVEAVRTGVSAFSEVWVTDAQGKQWSNVVPSRPAFWGLSPASDGGVFLLGNVSGVVKAWSAQAGSPAATPVALPATEGALQVAASPFGDRVLVVKPAGVALLTTDRKPLGSLPLQAVAEVQWSPQGDRIAVGVKSAGGEGAVKLLSVAADGRLTETASFPGANPAWRSDGGALALVRSNLIWRIDADGQNPAPLATVPVAVGEEAVVRKPAWDPSGKGIAFAVARASLTARSQELWLLPLGAETTPQAVAEGGEGQPVPIVQPAMLYSEEPATEYALSSLRWSVFPAWTSDGRLLFSSDRDGSPRVWSVRSDGSDLRAITPPGAIWPALGADGVYFVRLDSDTLIWKVSADGSDLVPLALKS